MPGIFATSLAIGYGDFLYCRILIRLLIKVIQRLLGHPDSWVISALGAGIHYSIKKGLDQEYVKILFGILLSMAYTSNK